jgi:GMP synthase (glutamine-hydrolysing)
MVKRVVALRHVGFEDLGSFESVLQDAGYFIYYRNATRGVDDIDPVSAELLVVLGGPIGVYEGGAYPFLDDERRLLAARLRAKRPTLGICLGAQLVAAALGGKVYASGTKEIGFSPLALTDTGAKGALRHLTDVPVLHWHGDTFDLPLGAQLLASTSVCRNQAFAIGAHGLALQFHPEADMPDDIEDWLVGHAAELAAAKVDVRVLRARAEEVGPTLREAGRRMLQEWLDGLPA